MPMNIKGLYHGYEWKIRFLWTRVEVLCQTYHNYNYIQSESRFLNKLILGVEYKFWCHCGFIHKINFEFENA